MKQLRNEQGYALAIAVLVITVLSILGISLMATTGNSKKMANKEQENQAAYYIAEAGMNLKKAEIKKAADQFRKDTAGWKDSKLEEALKQSPKINISTTYNSKNSNGTDKVFDTNNASAKVTVEYTTKPGAKTTTDNQTKAVQNYIYKIKSVGMIDNQKRTITSTMSYDLTVNSEEQKPEEKPDENKGGSKYVIHALGKMEFATPAIIGKIGIYDENNYSNDYPFNLGWGSWSYKYSEQSPTLKNKCSNTFGYPASCYSFDAAVKKEHIIKGDKKIPKLPVFPEESFNVFRSELNSNLALKSKLQNFNMYKANNSREDGIYKIFLNDLKNGIKIDDKNITLIVVDEKKPNELSTISLDNSQYISLKNSKNLNLVVNTISLSNTSNISSTGPLNIFSDSINLSNETKIVSSNNLIVNTNALSLTNNTELKSSMNLSLFTKDTNISVDTKINSTKDTNLYIENSFNASNNLGLTGEHTNIFYKGKSHLNLINKIVYKADLYSFNSCINIETAKVTGDIFLYNNSNSSDYCLIQNSPVTTKNYYLAPTSNIKFEGEVVFTGSLIANNIQSNKGGTPQITYKTPEIGVMPDPLPPGNNGSNNGDSIIIDSSFSDAIDSGTVEIDNDR